MFTAIQMKMPSGLPAMAMLAARAPKMVGSSEPKMESPMEASGPMRPVFSEATVSRLCRPSSSSIARSIPVMIVLRKLEVLKNGAQWVRAAVFRPSVLSP